MSTQPDQVGVNTETLAGDRPQGSHWNLDLSFQRGGPWGGIDDLVRSIFSKVYRVDQELLSHHAHELLVAAPDLCTKVEDRYQNLTDLAQEGERVRYYPENRSLRFCHGLIDLCLTVAKRGYFPTPWSLELTDYEDAGAISKKFLSELVRRAESDLRLRLKTLTDSVYPETDEQLAKLGASQAPGTISTVNSPRSSVKNEGGAKKQRLRDQAESLEQSLREGDLPGRYVYPRLVDLLERRGEQEQALHWRAEAFSAFTALGLYPDAYRYGRPVIERLDHYTQGDAYLRLKMIGKLFACSAAQGEPEALGKLKSFLDREVSSKLERDDHKGIACYFLAMLHARLLPEIDLREAERYLDQGVKYLEQAEVEDEGTRQFNIGFNRNGLALIRFRQGRPKEAIRLCRDAYKLLDEHLAGDQHRLHRSVLIYNMGQVYAAVGDHESALSHYSQAIEMDPLYTDYYNDRGNLYLQLGRLEEAKADYLKAIELSPPYHEVWTNLGQCLRQQGDWQAAVDAYTRSLDLFPEQPLACSGLADCRHELGDLDGALADYTASLDLEPENADTLGNRAVVLFGLGRVEEALADLDRAVQLAPEVPELRQNQAIALAELGQAQKAKASYQQYLDLAPEADDRAEVLATIESLEQVA